MKKNKKIMILNLIRDVFTNGNNKYARPLLTNPDIIIAEQNIKKLTRKKGTR